MADEFTIKTEATLVNMIKKNLRKEYHKDTHSSVNYIYDLLEKAYEEGIHYDVEWLHSDIYNFAAASFLLFAASINIDSCSFAFS